MNYIKLNPTEQLRWEMKNLLSEEAFDSGDVEWLPVIDEIGLPSEFHWYWVFFDGEKIFLGKTLKHALYRIQYGKVR